jgi:hypothetical protein
MLSDLTNQDLKIGPSPTYTDFRKTPQSTKKSVPNEIHIRLLGWESDDPNSVIGFVVDCEANYKAIVSLNSDNSGINVAVSESIKQDPTSMQYTVNLGGGAKATEWTLPFAPSIGGNTGSWVFSKAKGDDNDATV